MWWWRQSVHSSWVVALSCACFTGGVALAVLWQVPWFIGLLALVPLVYGVVVRQVWALSIVAVASSFIGIGYGSAHLASRSVYAEYVEQSVAVQGSIKEDPSKTPSGSISLQLETVSITGRAMPGVIYASVRQASEVKRGDIVTLDGIAKEGFGAFPISVSASKVTRVTRPVPGDVGRVVRDWFADRVREHIDEPAASLGIGFLTGQKSALPEDLSEALKIAGLTHIVVASGYNLTILVRLARKLFVKVSKFLSAVASGLMIMLFMTITGLSPSMTRAGLVSGISLMAWYYGRPLHPFVLLPFAAAITLALNPTYAWGDLSWQLSFAAFAGVMVVAPLLQRYFFGPDEPSILRQILGETIAAHIVTVPIIAINFGTISNVAIIANLLVVPLVPLAMLLTFACGVGAIFQAPFIAVISEPTSWLLSYMVSVAAYVSEIDWAQMTVQLPGWLWVAYLIAVISACLWMWRATKYRFNGSESVM